jgi:ATP-binding cassette subfamily B protein
VRAQSGELGPEDIQQEAALGRAYDARLMRRLWIYIRPYRAAFVWSLVLLPLISACSLVQPYLLKLGIDHYIGGKDAGGLMWIGVAYGLAMVAEFTLFYAQYMLTMHVAQHSLADLRGDLFAHVQTQSASFFDRNPVGRLVTRLTSDVDVINEAFAAGAFTIAMDMMTLVGIVVIMLTIDWHLALATLSVLPVLLLAINFFRVQARHSYRRIRERIARLNSYLQEALAGMTVIQLFARERASFRQFDDFNDAHRRANHASNVYEASLFSLVDSMSAICVALIVWYGGGRIVAASLAFGTLVAFIEYIQRFFVPIREFSTKYAVMQSAMASAERVFQLLDTASAVAAPAHPHRPAAVAGRIEFDHVSFAYRGDDFVLRDVSFTVEAGEKVALVGPTGSGKTTIIKLLNRSYDVNQGRVLVDGVDVRDWDLGALRRHVGVVLQDVFLFAGSVASNLTLGRADLTLETAQRAARTVHADPFIQRLSRNYDEPIRERGNNLSTGQRQLLAFARALAHDPTILVLDEATSSVDTETELLIQDALLKLMQRRTAIVIAHRLSTIEHVDRILVFHAGQLREHGTHAALLRQRGLYHRLYQLQYRQTQPAATAAPANVEW